MGGLCAAAPAPPEDLELAARLRGARRKGWGRGAGQGAQVRKLPIMRRPMSWLFSG